MAGWGQDWMRWGLERASNSMQQREAAAQQEAQQQEAQQESLMGRASEVVQALMNRNSNAAARKAEMQWKDRQASQERVAAYERDAARFLNDRTMDVSREARNDARLDKQLKAEDVREAGRAKRDAERDAREAARAEKAQQAQARLAYGLEGMRSKNKQELAAQRLAGKLAEVRARAAKDPLGSLARLEEIRKDYFTGYREDEIPADFMQTLGEGRAAASRGLSPGTRLPGKPPPGASGQWGTAKPPPDQIPMDE